VPLAEPVGVVHPALALHGDDDLRQARLDLLVDLLERPRAGDAVGGQAVGELEGLNRLLQRAVVARRRGARQIAHADQPVAQRDDVAPGVARPESAARADRLAPAAVREKTLELHLVLHELRVSRGTGRERAQEGAGRRFRESPEEPLTAPPRRLALDVGIDAGRRQDAGLDVAGVSEEERAQLHLGPPPVAFGRDPADDRLDPVGVVATGRKAMCVSPRDGAEQRAETLPVDLAAAGPERGVAGLAVEGGEVRIARGLFGDGLLEGGDLCRGGRREGEEQNHRGRDEGQKVPVIALAGRAHP
jgi:hypothetical protein